MGITVSGRVPSDVLGFTAVRAEVDGGAPAEFLVKNHIATTPAEIDEIRAQWERRQEARDVVKSGRR